MTPEPSERDKLAMVVARLAEGGLYQEEIMPIVNKSQAEVSRLLKHARDQQYMVSKLNIPPALVDEIEKRAFPRWADLFDSLQEVAGQQGSVPLTGLHVIYGGSAEWPEHERMDKFGQQSALRIVELLKPSPPEESSKRHGRAKPPAPKAADTPKPALTCAVAWGRTINSVVAGSRHLQPGDEWKRYLFFPTSGEPMNNRDTGISASIAAARLAEYFRCERPALSLSGVATRIPAGTPEGERQAILKFLRRCRHYEQIFDSTTGLITRTDTILTGIGDAKSSEQDPLFRETTDLERLSPDWLNERCVGNLGGIWLSKSIADDDPDVTAMNRRWLGVQQEHITRCGERAVKERKPGVIVVAVGAKKADILRRALGMINHLVIDHELANALLPPEPPTP